MSDAVEQTGRVTRSGKNRKRPALGDLSNNRSVRAKQAAKGKAGSSSRAGGEEAKGKGKKRATAAADETALVVQKERPQPKPRVFDIDLADKKDPQCCWEYMNEIQDHYRVQELKYRPSFSYIGDHMQTDINAQMRAILIDWLVEVAEEYNLMQETMYICVNLIDRCLSKFVMRRAHLQLLGCACMLLASKYEEIYAPAVDEFVYISDNTYTREQVLQMETKVLDYLDFHLTVTTTFTFMQRYLKAASACPKTKHLASYLSELSLPAYDMLKYTPSQVGAASVYLARKIMSSTQDVKISQIWTQELEHHSRYKFKDLRACLQDLHKLHVRAPEASLQAVREKYSHSNTMYVAYINPLSDISWLNVNE